VVGIGAGETSASPSEVVRQRLAALHEPTRALLVGELLDGGPLNRTACDLGDDWSWSVQP
jgi:hypothetical protein